MEDNDLARKSLQFLVILGGICSVSVFFCRVAILIEMKW